MLLRRQDPAFPSSQARTSSDDFLTQEEKALEAIHGSLDFLLEALAEDLNAPIPSKEPAFLYTANDRVYLVRTLIERLEAARAFLNTTEEHFGSQSPTIASQR